MYELGPEPYRDRTVHPQMCNFVCADELRLPVPILVEASKFFNGKEDQALAAETETRADPLLSFPPVSNFQMMANSYEFVSVRISDSNTASKLLPKGSNYLREWQHSGVIWARAGFVTTYPIT